MAPVAGERRRGLLERIAAGLAPFPGRLGFAARLALVCALTVLVAELYQTPEPALTAYVAFFLMKPDRASSVVAGVVMLLLISGVLGLVLGLAVAVIEQPLWRVTAMTLVSFCLTFAASASRLKPVAGTVALITAYALDLLGSVPGGELATRGILYVWLFVAIPAGISVVVNLVFGPSPRRLVERALADRLGRAAAAVRAPETDARQAFAECLREGPGEIPVWLKLAAVERSSPAADIVALGQAARSTIVILSVVGVLTEDAGDLLPASIGGRLAATLDGMAAILGQGGYPVEIALEHHDDEAGLPPDAATALAALRMALAVLAQPPAPDASPPPAARAPGGLFLPDAFTNPAHVQYALKTTGAAMFCYVAYLLLDWPGIHTCLITCYIVSLGTTAETVEKQALRFLGCGIGAVAGIAAIVFLMPGVTSIGGLMGVVFLAALLAGWIAAGGPRISYLGFQLGFAFLLGVVQGAAPAFDMTIVRDRTIGILFGDLVVAIVFTQAWPVTIAGRIDPAITRLLQRLAALATAAGAARRWAIAAEARAGLAAIEEDIDLARYEPPSIRRGEAWLRARRDVAGILSSLQGRLLVAAGGTPAGLGEAARQLERLAGRFDAAAARSAPMAGGTGPGGLPSAVAVPLAKLQMLAANLSEFAAHEGDDDA